MVAVVAFSGGCATSGSKTLAETGGKQWYKGNTHTHTLWSDGDAAPEWVVSWYKENGYDFLSLTDHNVVLHGHREYAVGPDSKLTPEHVDLLKEKFGASSVSTRSKGDGTAAAEPGQ